MKKYSFLVLIVALLCVATSCSKKKEKTRQDLIEEFRSELTSEDTTAMLRVADEAMELLKDKKIDQVIASLFEYNDSTKEVSPLSERLQRRYTRKFTKFPVLDYKREYFSFMLEGCNDVKYEVTFATAEQAGTPTAPTTKFMFNPVRVNGEWKLCVKTAGDEFDQEMN
jgi:hypothetical protein